MGHFQRLALSLASGAAFLGALVLGATPASAAQSMTMYIFGGSEGIKGPDGKSHDAFVPSSIVVKAGQPVTLTIVNYDESPHSITATGLGIALQIKPGQEVGEKVQPVTTTVTFTAKKKGVFRWFCATPCDMKAGMWAMGQGYGGPGKEGFMAGNIVVI